MKMSERERELRRAASKRYWAAHTDEINERRRAHYNERKDEINRKRRERYAAKKAETARTKEG